MPEQLTKRLLVFVLIMLENHQLNNEFNKKEEIKWAQVRLKYLIVGRYKAA